MGQKDDLKTLVTATQSRELERRWDYYTGRHPKIYVTPKIREIFRSLSDRFDENYCGLAINSYIRRMEVTGFEGPDAEKAQVVWDESRLAQRQGRLWRWGMTYGRVYLIADPDLGTHGQLAINKPTLAYGEPEPDDPETMRWLGKLWADPDKGWHAVLMYDGARYTYRTERKSAAQMSGWVLELEESNTGQVPGVELTPYDDGQPLIDTISGLNDRTNKLASNKFVAAEFTAFRQRVFFTRQDVTQDDLKQAPDEAIILDPGDSDGKASVQELSPTDLSNYDNGKSAEVDSIFTLATLPRHMRVNPGAPPSGESIKADEGPFIEAVRDYSREMGEGLAEALSLLDIDATPQFKDPTVHNELTQAQTVATLVDAGVPWQAAVRMYAGWAAEDITDAEALATVQVANGTGAALLGAFNSPGTPVATDVPADVEG